MNEEILNPGTTEMHVNEFMKLELKSAAKWMKFICIVGSIGMAFIVLLGLLLIVLGTGISQYLANTPLGGGIGFLYLIFAAIYIYPLLKGFQFANATRNACMTNNEAELTRGFEGLNKLLIFSGVLTIIVLVIYAFIFLSTVIFAVALS